MNATAQILFDELVNFIKKLGLREENIIGLGTGGANNLCGHKN